jgi:hypothetical protein
VGLRPLRVALVQVFGQKCIYPSKGRLLEALRAYRVCGRGGVSAMRTSYEVRAGKRLVSLQTAHTAGEAVIEYLRSLGCREDEITRVATDAATWRGAVYRAIPLGSD